jgi:hypothetical protein
VFTYKGLIPRIVIAQVCAKACQTTRLPECPDKKYLELCWQIDPRSPMDLRELPTMQLQADLNCHRLV